MQIDDTPSPRDWEQVVLRRIRDRFTDVDVDDSTDAGWEAAAHDRLRAHFESEG